ncbi:hypothetical protein [Nocardia goodfellowii]|uniref:DUF4345 domain-containing protein n=1 Tax=Nocardia goodfellowii TaxID=882446 RepID=A0ABS4QFN8_9NOCA|nr:hypothetical protein [Nocardia goodfellowii]MBP2190522.1 hypothetical protein [Nocardia goodfellowii]
MIKPLLIIAASYLLAIGLALLIVPVRFGIDAVPENPPSELVALLRLLGGPFLGIAALNWLCRNATPSPVRDAVLAANLIGFGVVAANDVVGVATGHARDLARVFLVIHAAFAVAFLLAFVRTRTSRDPSEPHPAE